MNTSFDNIKSCLSFHFKLYVCKMETESNVCGYCELNDIFAAVIDQLFQHHKTLPLKYKEQKCCDDRLFLLSKVIDIIPEDVDHEQIQINADSKSVIVNNTPSKVLLIKKLNSNQNWNPSS